MMLTAFNLSSLGGEQEKQENKILTIWEILSCYFNVQFFNEA